MIIKQNKLSYFSLFITVILSLSQKFYLDISLFIELPCNKRLISEIESILHIYPCLNESSLIISSLCPYEQAVLYNSLTFNSNNSYVNENNIDFRCFNPKEYKSQIKNILLNQVRKTTSIVSDLSYSIKTKYKCLNKISEELLSSSEIRKIVIPNQTLLNSQATYDGCLSKYIVSSLNNSLYIRRYLIRPVSQWRKYGVYDKNNKIKYFKFTSNHIKSTISSFRELTTCYIKTMKVNKQSMSLYSKVYSESKTCSSYEEQVYSKKKGLTENMKVFLIESLGERMSSKLNELPLIAKESILKYKEILNRFKTDDRIGCISNTRDFVSKVLSKNLTISDLIIKTISRSKNIEMSIGIDEKSNDISNAFQAVQSSLNEYKNNITSIFNDMFKLNMSKTRNFTGEVKQIPLVEQVKQEKVISNILFHNEDDSSISNSNKSGIDKRRFEISTQINLFRLLLKFPNNSISNSIQNIISSTENELINSKAYDIDQFPLCFSESIEKCQFSLELSSKMRASLPESFFENCKFLNDLITTIKASYDYERYFPMGVSSSISEIYDILIDDQPDQYIVINNNKCLFTLSNTVIDCNGLVNNNDMNDFFYFMFVKDNLKVQLIYYKNMNNQEYADVIFGDVSICAYDDIRNSMLNYNDINQECLEKLSSSCPSTPLDMNSNKENKVKTEYDDNWNIMQCVLTDDYSENSSKYDNECFAFIQHTFHNDLGMGIENSFNNIHLNSVFQEYLQTKNEKKRKSLFSLWNFYDLLEEIGDDQIEIDFDSEINFKDSGIKEDDVLVNGSSSGHLLVSNDNINQDIFGNKLDLYINSSCGFIKVFSFIGFGLGLVYG